MINLLRLCAPVNLYILYIQYIERGLWVIPSGVRSQVCGWRIFFTRTWQPQATECDSMLFSCRLQMRVWLFLAQIHLWPDAHRKCLVIIIVAKNFFLATNSDFIKATMANQYARNGENESRGKCTKEWVSVYYF